MQFHSIQKQFDLIIIQDGLGLDLNLNLRFPIELMINSLVPQLLPHLQDMGCHRRHLFCISCMSQFDPVSVSIP